MLKIKRRKKKNITENENHKHKTFIQRTQSDHDHDAYDINNRFIKLISNNEIIEKKTFYLYNFRMKNFSTHDS